MAVSISETFGGFFSNTVGMLIGVILFIFIFSLVVGGFYYFFVYKKRHDIMVKIVSKRHEDDRVFFDKGAITKDMKDKSKYLHLWNLNVELELPPFKVFQKTNKGDYVEILRKSEDDFKFLTPPKIDSEKYVGKDGKLHLFSSQKQREIESDTYWILSRKQKNKSIINPQNILMKLLEYAPQIISMTFSFFMLWIIFDKAPEIIGSLNELAKSIAAAQTPTVIQG